jgi:hypothetical protein
MGEVFLEPDGRRSRGDVWRVTKAKEETGDDGSQRGKRREGVKVAKCEKRGRLSSRLFVIAT